MLVALFSLPGALLSVFLTIAKFRSEYRCDSSILSACASSWFDCNRVLDSPWSTMFRLPISVFSTAFFLVLGGLAWAALWNPIRLLVVVRPMILWMAWAGLLAVVTLASYAYFGVESACSYCVAIYGITLSVFLAASLMHPGGHRAGLMELFAPVRRRGSVWLLAFLAFLALVSAQMVRFFSGVTKMEFDSCLTDGELPPSALETGSKRARVQIAVFLDLACEFCRREYDGWRRFVAEHPAEYRLKVYHYARDGACVPPDFPWFSWKSAKHASCEAAQGVECAERFKPGAGLAMIDALFALQDTGAPYFEVTKIAAAARAIGISVAQETLDDPFIRCLTSKETTPTILQHARYAWDQGLTSTPVTYLTFYDEKGRDLPRMIYVKGAKNYGSVEKTLQLARKAAEQAPGGR